jgi:hypothetical protein
MKDDNKNSKGGSKNEAKPSKEKPTQIYLSVDGQIFGIDVESPIPFEYSSQFQTPSSCFRQPHFKMAESLYGLELFFENGCPAVFLRYVHPGKEK